MKTIDQLSEEEETKRGKLLAQALHLRKRKSSTDIEPRFQTEWGSKSELGLFRMISRIVQDGE